MSRVEAKTEQPQATSDGWRLWQKPIRVFLLAAAASFSLGVVFGFLDSLDLSSGFDAVLFIAIVLVALGSAAVSVVAAVGSIGRKEVEEEFWLLFGSSVFGVIIFLPILWAFLVGFCVQFMIGLDEIGGDSFDNWGEFMAAFMALAGVLSLIIGAPVGLIAWVSRFARAQKLPTIAEIAGRVPWPWRIGLGVPLLLGLALALGAVISWLSPGYEPPEELVAGRVDEFAVGAPKLFEEEDIWLVRLSDASSTPSSFGEFVALYDRGVESGCPLQWRPQFEFMSRRGWFVDACNGWAYDATGYCAPQVCQGAQLDRFRVHTQDGNVIVQLEPVIRNPASRPAE